MKKLNKESEKINILLFLLFIGCIGVSILKPIAQDLNYHHFADARIFFSIPNFWNVVSNIPFLIVGAGGMYYYSMKSKAIFPSTLKTGYIVFYAGVFLTGLGSSWYHLDPNNTTLVWDRLPMTISFMSFFAIIIAEFISPKNNRVLLIALLCIGVSSVLYWNYTELQGRGDLRFYIAVQFIPMLLIPFILLVFTSGDHPRWYLWLVLFAYLLAKVTESFDQQLFQTLHFVSGHTIKHLFAAMAPLIFLYGAKQRADNKKTG